MRSRLDMVGGPADGAVRTDFASLSVYHCIEAVASRLQPSRDGSASRELLPKQLYYDFSIDTRLVAVVARRRPSMPVLPLAPRQHRLFSRLALLRSHCLTQEQYCVGMMTLVVVEDRNRISSPRPFRNVLIIIPDRTRQAW